MSVAEKMKNVINRKNVILALRILLPLLCAAMLAFIFGNSLQTGEQSAATSSKVVETVQEVAKAVAPQSPIATATGAAYDKLHADIRALAHFTEFALLGALVCGCYLVYTRKKSLLFIPVVGLLLVPIADEYLQSFTSGRATEIVDIAVDFCGGCVGFAIVLASFFVTARLWNRRKGQNVEALENAENAEEKS